MSKNSKRRNIYMGDELERLANGMIGGNFSRKINEIVARYTLMLNMVELPNFTDKEKVALGELLLSAELSRSKIMGLALDVEDLGKEFLDNEEKQVLIDKIKSLTPLQIIKILDILENGD